MSIRISPHAYQKVAFFTRKDVEVGGFAITSPEDPSLILDFVVLPQTSSSCEFDFSPDGMQNYLNEMVDAGISPNNCFRMYIHTHPGNSPQPSSVDNEQFDKLMQDYPWFGMIIFAKDLSTYARVKMTQGCGLEAELDLEIDWDVPCEPVDFNELDKIFDEKVSRKQTKIKFKTKFIEHDKHIHTRSKEDIPWWSYPEDTGDDRKRFFEMTDEEFERIQ